MTIQLGENSWILIVLILLEILFVIIPAYVSSKIEKKTFKILLHEMGFQKNEDIFLKVIAGLSFGILFFFAGDLIIVFFRDIIVENLLGTGFVEEANQGAITTIPIQPSLIQLFILIILQILIIGPCEEAFFRAFLIKKLNYKMKQSYSILISSICFAFYHVPPFLVPTTTILTFFGYFFLFGVILALIFIYFNYSIIPVAIMHSLFNILILI
ncbi:hypothetical protein LCGC14_1274750 [marine sediment metagenome]|uniref:CAAX prenyl protease 2/Lysostaphin resistance protein A-like domain-containing protein n=1 Tax=marine sediment metagenome TaxID=412755 RepID=A0A0F9LI89_9ZZZZ|nr:CPBP family intramembrane metalloprotease [bacterium]